MKKESKDFIRGATWAINRLQRKLPLGNDMLGGCPNECSADAVYYLEDMRKILVRNVSKKP